MCGRYAYSFNGEDYVGAFETRESAEAAAFAAAGHVSDPPATVFVARAVTGDPGASGHARRVLAEMAVRAHQQAGPGGARYLADLSSPQIYELDAALEAAIVAWLNKYQLMPAFFRVDAISEHSVPVISQNHVFESAQEVHDLGVGDGSLAASNSAEY